MKFSTGLEAKFPEKRDPSSVSKALGHDVELSSNGKGLSLLIFPNAVDTDVSAIIDRIQPERPGIIQRATKGEVLAASVGGDVALTVPDATLESFLERSQAEALTAEA